jgi:hypothetical protein
VVAQIEKRPECYRLSMQIVLLDQAHLQAVRVKFPFPLIIAGHLESATKPHPMLVQLAALISLMLRPLRVPTLLALPPTLFCADHAIDTDKNIAVEAKMAPAIALMGMSSLAKPDGCRLISS